MRHACHVSVALLNDGVEAANIVWECLRTKKYDPDRLPFVLASSFGFILLFFLFEFFSSQIPFFFPQ